MKWPRPAFTLLELMLSMAVAGIVLFLLLEVTSHSAQEYQRSYASISAEKEARYAVAQIKRDFSAHIENPQQKFVSGSLPWRCDEVSMFCLKPADAQTPLNNFGDLCAIHYYIKDHFIEGNTVRCLMRGCLGSDETFKRLAAHPGSTLFDRSEKDEIIASGVVSFVVGITDVNTVRISLTLARRTLYHRLKTSAAWDSTAGPLGMPEQAETNPFLEIYHSLGRL